MTDTNDEDDEEAREKYGICGGAETVSRVKEAVEDADDE